MSTGLTRDERFLRAVVDESAHGVFAVDTAGNVVYSNGVLEERLGRDPDELRNSNVEALAGEQVLERIREAARDPPGQTLEFGLDRPDGTRLPLAATVETTEFEDDRYFTLWFQERVIEDRGRTTGTLPAGGRPAPAPLTAVTGLGEDLLEADEPEAVAEAALDAIRRVVGADVACVRLFDGAEQEFERVATTQHATELLDSRPTFDLNRSLAGRAFRREDTVVDRPDGAGSGEAVGRANVHVPLAGHGALTVFASGDGLTNRDVELLEGLAGLVAAALGRVGAGSANRPGGAREAYELPLSEIVADAVRAETQAGIGRQLCQRLVGTGVYSGAWFVTTDIDGEWRAVEARVGDTDSPPEGVRRAETGGEGDGADPTSRAIETDDICVVRNQQTVRSSGPETNGDGHPDSQVETTVVVPVSHVDRTYGVLVLRADSDRELDDRVRSELDVIGDIAGLATYAAESKKLLLSEKVQQLEFEVTDPDCLAVVVSEATDAFCEIEHQTLTNEGTHLCYVQIEGASPERARDVTADIDTVTDCRIVEVGEDGCLLEVVKTQSGAEAMMDVGATVRRATAEAGVGTLIVETPLSADVREVVDAYTAMNPESRLVAKREIDRPIPTTGSLTDGLDDVLTDKQHSVLTAAYYAGYFDWPRANTAEEVADSLEISPATFHQHLRASERKLLELVCEEQAHLHDR